MTQNMEKVMVDEREIRYAPPNQEPGSTVNQARPE